MNDADDCVVIERVFRAPISTVWSMWTEADHFARWYGPTGATLPIAEIDLRVGGKRRVCMEMATPNGPMRMWFSGEHLVIEPPHRLVYTETMTDPDGVEVAAPGEKSIAPTEVTVELHDIDGDTRVTLTHRGIPAGSPGEMGWTMALDKLSDELGHG